MSMPMSFWFVFWRMNMWGLLWHTVLSCLVFGAILVAVFGTALPTPSGTGHLGLRGALFGTFAGAIEGSALGALCGLLPFATTRAFYFPAPTNAHDYLATAGATCALAGLTLMLADWLVQGCPDPNALALWRTLNMLAPGETAWPTDTGVLTFGTGPLLVATLDMWLSGSGAARWYIREAQRQMSYTSSGGWRPQV
ncbi:hypothetical protein BH18ACT10_BH18ACT10_18180 [soil metagenome]